MQIVPVSSSNLIPRPAALDRPAAGRGVERVTELLSHTSARSSAERVLQGELLEGGREPEGAFGRGASVYENRLEDHPAFYPRHTNHAYVQRRALAAYQSYANADAASVSGRGVDYFV